MSAGNLENVDSGNCDEVNQFVFFFSNQNFKQSISLRSWSAKKYEDFSSVGQTKNVERQVIDYILSIIILSG